MKNFFTKDNFSLPEGFLEATAAVARSTMKTEAIATDDAHEMVHVPGYGVLKRHQAEHEAHLASSVAHEHLMKGNYAHAAIQHERAAMFGKALHAHSAAKSVSEETQQIDELSKKTLGSYVNKASERMFSHGSEHGEGKAQSDEIDRLTNRHGNSYTKKPEIKKLLGVKNPEEHREKAARRHISIQRAVAKLTKEEGQVEGTVSEDQQEPHLGRVQDKYRREQARKMKNKDKERKEGKEERYK